MDNNENKENLKNSSKRKRGFWCHKCYEKFDSEENRKIHVQKQSCDLPGQVFSDENSENEEKIDKRQKRFRCLKCLKSFSSDEDRKDHDLGNTCKPFDDKDNVISEDNIVFKNDKNTPKNVQKFWCRICLKNFETREEQRQHETNETCDDFYGKCQKCDKKFNHRLNLNIHLESCLNNQSLLECQRCKKTFDRLDALIRHVKSVHLEIFDHKCQNCGLTCRDKHDFKQHNSRCIGVLRKLKKPTIGKKTSKILGNLKSKLKKVKSRRDESKKETRAKFTHFPTGKAELFSKNMKKEARKSEILPKLERKKISQVFTKFGESLDNFKTDQKTVLNYEGNSKDFEPLPKLDVSDADSEIYEIEDIYDNEDALETNIAFKTSPSEAKQQSRVNNSKFFSLETSENENWNDSKLSNVSSNHSKFKMIGVNEEDTPGTDHALKDPVTEANQQSSANNLEFFSPETSENENLDDSKISNASSNYLNFDLIGADSNPDLYDAQIIENLKKEDNDLGFIRAKANSNPGPKLSRNRKSATVSLNQILLDSNPEPEQKTENPPEEFGMIKLSPVSVNLNRIILDSNQGEMKASKKIHKKSSLKVKIGKPFKKAKMNLKKKIAKNRMIRIAKKSKQEYLPKSIKGQELSKTKTFENEQSPSKNFNENDEKSLEDIIKEVKAITCLYCDFCYDLFTTGKLLVDHIKTKHPMPCKICGKIFYSKNFRKVHMKNKHDIDFE